jgi:hypothetical protein
LKFGTTVKFAYRRSEIEPHVVCAGRRSITVGHGARCCAPETFKTRKSLCRRIDVEGRIHLMRTVPLQVIFFIARYRARRRSCACYPITIRRVVCSGCSKPIHVLIDMRHELHGKPCSLRYSAARRYDFTGCLVDYCGVIADGDSRIMEIHHGAPAAAPVSYAQTKFFRLSPNYRCCLPRVWIHE